jgi:signal transduction histidine kinase
VHPECQLAVFRVLQEALHNVQKHAGARAVEVKVVFHDDRIELTAEDDGQGFDPAQGRAGHFGLLHMQERARRVGGELQVESQPGKGAAVRLQVPVELPEATAGKGTA